MMKPNFKNLIPKEEALEKIFNIWHPVSKTETISINEAKGQILAEDIYAQYNFPMVRASRMDGIAVKSDQFANGIPDTSNWKLGIDFIRADTGDDFDDAFDSVIPIEQVTLLPDGGVTLTDDVKVEKGSNVKPQGTDIQKGTLAVPTNTLLSALDVTAIAMCGYTEILVIKKPIVAFVPTGSELIALGNEPSRGQRFDTNSIMVRQILEEYGATPLLHPIVKDDKASIEEALNEMLPKADIVILNAGTSKGGEDYCVEILKERGELIFSGVAAVPGRPMSVSMIDNKPVINMSGPSFAAFYSTDWMIQALVYKQLGINMPKRKTVQAKLTEKFTMPPFFSQMARFQVKTLEDGSYEATPLAFHGPKSAGEIGMMRANGLYITSLGEQPHEAGEIITIELTKD